MPPDPIQTGVPATKLAVLRILTFEVPEEEGRPRVVEPPRPTSDRVAVSGEPAASIVTVWPGRKFEMEDVLSWVAPAGVTTTVATPLAWARPSGAARVRPVPPEPEVPTAITEAVSWFAPVSIAICWFGKKF